MTIAIIAAIGSRGELGFQRDLPWGSTMQNDMRFFAHTTRGHHVIMGRTSFEDILRSNGAPLPERTSIVLSRSPQTHATANVFFATELPAALDLARLRGESEAFIIGGAEVFRQGLEIADKLYITRIHAAFEADTFFPDLAVLDDELRWRETKRINHPADSQNPHPYSFTELVRV
jgi:dihydrofolate reductase